MNYERSRLRTFENWPANAPIDSVCIAKAGFYYMGQNLEVQCFSCGGRISEWQYGDKVMAKHRLLDPRCPFVVNSAESGNVPISDGNDTAQTDSNEIVEDGSKYKNEDARLQSFMAWPIPSGIDGHRLAKAGFYWLQELRKVRCAFCGIDNPHWDSSVDPIIEHRRHSPNCPFLNNLSVGCSSENSNDVIVLRQDFLEPERELNANQMKNFGILNHRIPKHSKYMTEESRIASFETWPVSEIKTPQELANAGFYYTGVEDKVRCYHCGGGLQKWKITDDPWIEHAKWFSTCDYVFLVKGKEFVDEIKQTIVAKKESLKEEGHSLIRQSTSQQADRSMPLQNIDDNTIQTLMSTSTVLTVLELGLDMSRIKHVLRDRLERHHTTFSNVDELLAAVLDAQFNEPVADLTEESWISDPIAGVSDLNRLPVFENNFTEQGSSRYIHQLIERSLQNAHNNAESLIDENIINSANSVETGTILVTDDDRTTSNSEPEDFDANVDITENETHPPITEPPPSPEVDPQTLEEENRLLKQAKLCKICMDRDVNIVFLPCGHLISCSACAANLPDCPVCRQIIKGTVRTFLA